MKVGDIVEISGGPYKRADGISGYYEGMARLNAKIDAVPPPEYRGMEIWLVEFLGAPCILQLRMIHPISRSEIIVKKAAHGIELTSGEQSWLTRTKNLS